MENNNYIIALPVIEPVNKHDNTLLSNGLEKFREAVDYLHLDTNKSYLTLDSGFDSEDSKVLIQNQNLMPIIKPNPRNSNRDKRYAMLDEFEENESIYKERYHIERNFAWKTKYRKLVIRYEKLQCTHMGFRYLAYSMINYREIFGKNRGKP